MAFQVCRSLKSGVTRCNRHSYNRVCIVLTGQFGSVHCVRQSPLWGREGKLVSIVRRRSLHRSHSTRTLSFCSQSVCPFPCSRAQRAYSLYYVLLHLHFQVYLFSLYSVDFACSHPDKVTTDWKVISFWSCLSNSFTFSLQALIFIR